MKDNACASASSTIPSPDRHPYVSHDVLSLSIQTKGNQCVDT